MEKPAAQSSHHWMKKTNESIGYALQNSAQFLELLWRENKGKVQDLITFDLLLGRHMYDLLEAWPRTFGDWFFFLEENNVLKGFE
jgi:hypothetical protein